MTPAFPETTYGIVKRLNVIEAWLGGAVQRLGKSKLEILDIGCGTGDQITVPLARLGHEVLGVDMHDESIRKAQAANVLPNLAFSTATLDELIASGRRFDSIVCSEVLEHVDDPVPFLSQLRTLLRDDGCLLLTTPNGYGAYEWMSSLERGLRRTGVHQLIRGTFWNFRRGLRKLKGQPPPLRPLENLTSGSDSGFLNIDSGHVQFFSVKRLEHIFQSAGFTVAGRRARTFLCGPYLDVMFSLLPARPRMLEWNNRAADALPFSCAADWMYCLQPARPKEGV